MFKSIKNYLLKEQVLRSSSWGHHFFFLNCILSIAIGSTYVYAAPEAQSFVAFVYLVVSWFGQIGFLSFLAFLILLFPLSFIGNFKLYRIIAVILAIALHLLLLIDAKLFLSIKVHLTWMVTSLIIRDLDFKTGLNFNFLYLAFVLLLALELFFAKLSTRELYQKQHRTNRFPSIVMSFVAVCFIASHGIYIWADAVAYERITNLRTLFPAHYPMTAKSFLSNHGWLDSDNSSNLAYSSNSSFNYPLTEISISPKEHNQNLINIFVNGMSYADLDLKNTPNLMTLKQENLSFENHYLPYVSLEDNMFASAFGLPIEYRQDFFLHDVKPVTISALGEMEYLIRLYSSSKVTDHQNKLSTLFGIRQNKSTLVESDRQVFDNAYNFIENLSNDSHFILNLNTNLLLKAKSPAQKEVSLLALDKMLGEFIEKLSENGVLDNTTIIITSSVGSNLGNSQDFNLKTQHVPLIMLLPNASIKGVSYQKLTSAFDFVPTLSIEILGVQTPCVNYSIGNNLLGSEDKEHIVTTHANELLLIDKNKVTFYRKNGRAYVYNDKGQKQYIQPNLETLIRAMRDLNRFKG